MHDCILEFFKYILVIIFKIGLILTHCIVEKKESKLDEISEEKQ